MKTTKILDLLLLSTLIFLSQSASVKSADFCRSNKDCSSVNFCNLKTEKCVHFPISSINTIEIIGLVTIQLLLILTNSVGVHGGVIILPILVLFLGFDVKEAIPLIKAMSFFGSFVYFILHMQVKHPNRDSPAINFDIILMITPLLLLGTITGLNVSMVIPSWTIMILSICFLFFFIYKTINKGVLELEQVKKENAEQLKIAEEKQILQFIRCQEQVDGVSTKFKDQFSHDEKTNRCSNSIAKLETYENNGANDYMLEVCERKDYKEEVKEIEQRMKQIIPLRTISIVLALISVFLFFLYFRGSRNLNSFVGIKHCSYNYWYAYIAFASVCVCSAGLIGWYLISLYKRKRTIGFRFVLHDLHWNWKSVVIFSLYSFFLGLLGPVGIGSSSLTIPLLFSIGLSKEQVYTTNTFINILAGFSIGVEFIVNGSLNIEWMLLLSLICIFSIFLAVFAIRKLLKYMGNLYLWHFLLGAILCAGSGLVVYSTVLNINMIT